MKKRVFPLVLMLLPLSVMQAQQQDAGLIMSKSRDLSLISSLNATVNLSITEKNGASRSRTISMTTKSFSDGLEKRFIRFIEPADVRGTSMLVVDNKNMADEMWIYLPALKKTRRIVSSEKGKSFMSSEFTNADMSSPPPPILKTGIWQIQDQAISGSLKAFPKTKTLLTSTDIPEK